MKEAARRIIHTYATEHADDLQRVWETERPFELHLDGITITRRADVTLDHEDGVSPDWRSSITRRPSTRAAPTTCSCRCAPTPAAAKGSTFAVPTCTTSVAGDAPGRRRPCGHQRRRGERD